MNIVCLSQHKSALIYKSLGVEVIICTPGELPGRFREVANQARIVIVDEELSSLVIGEERPVYPIILPLPNSGRISGESLEQMSRHIEKSIGITLFPH